MGVPQPKPYDPDPLRSLPRTLGTREAKISQPQVRLALLIVLDVGVEFKRLVSRVNTTEETAVTVKLLSQAR